MARLSVNINKIATIRNARGGNNPNVTQVAIDCEHFGAEGITIHPRPDQRHITHEDVINLKEIVKTELNIEGNPDKRFLELVKKTIPTQATLVPDSPDAITSNAGWDTIKNQSFLTNVIEEIKKEGIRTSIFVEPSIEMVEGAAKCGADRIELYTEPYANFFFRNKKESIKRYIDAAKKAIELGLGINAGHDLDLNNLGFFVKNVPGIVEVSIGHALICDAIYLGLENTIQLYLREAHNSCN